MARTEKVVITQVAMCHPLPYLTWKKSFLGDLLLPLSLSLQHTKSDVTPTTKKSRLTLLPLHSLHLQEFTSFSCPNHSLLPSNRMCPFLLPDKTFLFSMQIWRYKDFTRSPTANRAPAALLLFYSQAALLPPATTFPSTPLIATCSQLPWLLLSHQPSD